MQKREQSKNGGVAASSGAPAPKRGHPIGNGTNNALAAATVAAPTMAAGDSVASSTLFGPSLQVYITFIEQNNSRIVLALQSELKNELTWALNALTLLSFKDKDEIRRDATPLSKIPGLLDALLQVIDDWCDIALPRVLTKRPRVRLQGTNSVVTRFGSHYEAFNSVDSFAHPRAGPVSSSNDGSSQSTSTPGLSDWWFEEDDLFNLDEEGRIEKQQCVVAAAQCLPCQLGFRHTRSRISIVHP